MYKLLTEEARKKVRHEYLLRRSVVMVIAFISVLVVSMVGLFPSYVLSKAQQKELADRLGLANSLEPEEGAINLEAWLAQINLKLQLLAPALDRDRPSLALAQVIKEKGSGVRINALSWLRKEGESGISISGVASDRQALLSLEKRLNDSEYFAQVTLPVSNLARERDIPFELKLVPVKTP